MKILESYKKMAKQLLIEQPIKFKDQDGKDHEIDMDTAKQYAADVKKGDSSDYKKAAVKAAGLDKDDSDAKGGDAPEKEPAGKLGSGDFERGSDDGDSEQDALAKDKEWQKKAAASVGLGSKDQSDDDDSTGGDPDDSWDDEEGKPKPSGDKTKKTGFVSKNKPQKAKDLANDPSADTGPDSRGTDWDASYYGADDSAEWEDQYRDAEEDEDEDELAQIKWFGEKQGWGKDGELPSTSARTGKELGKNETLMINGKEYRRVQEQKGTSKKYSLRETYERIGGK